MSQTEPIGRTLCLDLGTKRIGVAVSDARGTLASPLVVLHRSGDAAADHRKIIALIAEEEAVRLVIGVPVALNGKKELAAQTMLEEIEVIRAAVEVPVETFDERMSSAAANKSLAAQGISQKKRREQIDKYAAAEILQGWLNAR